MNQSQMNFKVNGLDHVQLAAPKDCEESARRFYGDILGMQRCTW